MTPAVCQICQQTAKWTLVRTVRDVASREVFSIMACPSCGVLRMLPVPKDLRPYYDADVAQDMRARPNPIFSFLKRRLIEIELGRILSSIRPDVVLDIGSGSGDIALAVHRRGIRVITADAAAERPVFIQALSDIPYLHMDYDTCQIEGLSLRGRCLVILRHVLEHVKDPAQLLRQLAAYGVTDLYCAVPNSANPGRTLFGESWFHWAPPLHLWHFHQRSLNTLLRGQHWRVLKHGYDTIPDLIPSFYRYLRLRQAPSWLYRPFSPKGGLSGLSAPLNLLLPGNVLWVLATKEGTQ